MMLGNLSVSEIEDRLGIKFPEHIQEFMKNNRQMKAEDIAKGKWHCFDMPFHIVCGDRETAEKIYYSVLDKTKECKAELRFSIQK